MVVVRLHLTLTPLAAPAPCCRNRNCNRFGQSIRVPSRSGRARLQRRRHIAVRRRIRIGLRNHPKIKHKAISSAAAADAAAADVGGSNAPQLQALPSVQGQPRRSPSACPKPLRLGRNRPLRTSPHRTSALHLSLLKFRPQRQPPLLSRRAA